RRADRKSRFRHRSRDPAALPRAPRRRQHARARYPRADDRGAVSARDPHARRPDRRRRRRASGRGRADSRGGSAVTRSIRRFGVETVAAIGTALRGIVANRMRAFLSTIGIAIGVATLMTIYGMVSGLTTQFTTQISALGSNTMYVTSRPWVIRGDWWEYRNRPPITRADVAALRHGASHLPAVAPLATPAPEPSFRNERIRAPRLPATTTHDPH